MCWRCPQEMETNVAHVVCFARVCSSNHFSLPFPPYICFHSLHVLPTSSVSVINNHVPISRTVYPFSNMLLVFTVRVLYFPRSHGSQLLFHPALLYMIKMSSFHRVFLFIIVVAAFFFPPLNIYKPRRELFSVCLPIYGKQSSQGWER